MLKPNCRYLSALICWMNVLKHMLNSSGLRQSPCNTPQPMVIHGVSNSVVMIEVLKFGVIPFWILCAIKLFETRNEYIELRKHKVNIFKGTVSNDLIKHSSWTQDLT